MYLELNMLVFKLQKVFRLLKIFIFFIVIFSSKRYSILISENSKSIMGFWGVTIAFIKLTLFNIICEFIILSNPESIFKNEQF